MDRWIQWRQGLLAGRGRRRACEWYPLALSRWSDFASGIVSFTVCVGLLLTACDVSLTTLDGNATDAWIDMSLAT